MIIAALNRFHSLNQDSTATTTNYEQVMGLLDSSNHSSFFELVSGGLGSCLLLGNWCDLVQLHEFGKIELWLLEDLDLSDHAVVLEWEDFGGVLLNLGSDLLFN